MTCEEAREHLLEGDLRELRKTGTSPLARHLGGCADCRKVARLIREEERALNQELESVRASVGMGTVPVAVPPGRQPAPRPHPVRGWPLTVAAATVAAAALAGIFLVPSPSPDPSPPTVEAAPPPVVEPRPTDRVAVFQTRDPDLTFIWIDQE